MTLNLAVIRAATDSAEDADAVRKLDNLANGAFLGPMLEGRYPADLLAQTAARHRLGFVQDGDLATAQVPIDVLGINYYSTILAEPLGRHRRAPAGRRPRRLGGDAVGRRRRRQLPGAAGRRTRRWAGTSTRRG